MKINNVPNEKFYNMKIDNVPGNIYTTAAIAKMIMARAVLASANLNIPPNEVHAAWFYILRELKDDNELKALAHAGKDLMI